MRGKFSAGQMNRDNNMVNEIEKKFINQFIVKNKQERLLYEWSGPKRQNGIGRFCHNAENMLASEKIIFSSNHLFYDEIIKTTEKYNITGLWYIIAYNVELDGTTCVLSEALNLVLGNGMPAIIISDKLAIIETEQCCGTPKRYILHS